MFFFLLVIGVISDETSIEVRAKRAKFHVEAYHTYRQTSDGSLQ